MRLCQAPHRTLQHPACKQAKSITSMLQNHS